MKKMKRLFAGLLAVIMLAMATPVYAFTSIIDDVEVMDLTQNEVIDLLMALDIIEGYEDGEFHGERTVTRAEMATIVVKTLKLEPAAAMNVFDDVAIDHWANGYITRAVAEEIVVGDGNGNFRPEDKVSYAEMYTMLVKVLGYTPNGDIWPTNFTTRAREIGLTSGIYAANAADATRYDVAIAIWNMLNVPALRIAGSANGEDITLLGSTILANEYEDVKLVEDVKFNKYELVSKTDEDFEIKVKLGSKKYIYNENDFYTIPVGTKVDVLVIDDTIVGMDLAEDYEIVKGNGVELDAEEIDGLANIDDWKYGYVTLLDGEYEAKLVRDEVANSIIVEKVSLNKKVKKVEFIDGTRLSVDEDEMNKYMFIIDGERATVADLEAGDVLTQIDDRIYEVSRNVIAGDFEKFSSEKVAKGYAYNTIVIDGEEYRYTKKSTKFYDEDYKAIDVDAVEEGAEVTAYLTNNNEVVAVVVAEAIETYGIVEDIENGVMYLADGNEYDIADKNGAKVGNAVVYHFVKGEIVIDKVYTVKDAQDATTVVTDVEKDNITLSTYGLVPATLIKTVLETEEYEIYLIDIDAEDEEFDDIVKVEEEELVPSFFEVNDRIEMEENYIVVVRGF